MRLEIAFRRRLAITSAGESSRDDISERRSVEGSYNRQYPMWNEHVEGGRQTVGIKRTESKVRL